MHRPGLHTPAFGLGFRLMCAALNWRVHLNCRVRLSVLMRHNRVSISTYFSRDRFRPNVSISADFHSISYWGSWFSLRTCQKTAPSIILRSSFRLSCLDTWIGRQEPLICLYLCMHMCILLSGTRCKLLTCSFLSLSCPNRSQLLLECTHEPNLDISWAYTCLEHYLNMLQVPWVHTQHLNPLRHQLNTWGASNNLCDTPWIFALDSRHRICSVGTRLIPVQYRSPCFPCCAIIQLQLEL